MSAQDKYIESSNVKVFPSTKRGQYQISARLMSEASLISIINRLVDRDGFVITPEADLATNPFAFNIHGYYFEVPSITAITSLFTDTSATAIYGNIKLEETGDYVELDGQDDSGIYKGIQFSDAALGDSYFSLKLFEKSGNTWSVPSDSRIRFSSDSIDIDFDTDVVDGGVIS